MSFTYKRKFTLSIIIVLSILFFSCKSTEKMSDLKLETDDRATEETYSLIDVSVKIENHINNIINRERVNLSISRDSSQNQILEFIRNVKTSLAREVEGSGVSLLVTEISPLVQIEEDMNSLLSPEKNEILFRTFSDSKYSENKIGLVRGRTYSLKFLSTANRSIAPVVKVGTVLIGTDKLAHFFEQGYWYFDNNLSEEERLKYGYFMEGHPNLPEEEHNIYRDLMRKDANRYLVKFGYFGSASTGIISIADMNANEGGFQFYKKLQASPGEYKFSFKDYNFSSMNEENVKNLHTNGILENEINFKSGFIGSVQQSVLQRFSVFFCKTESDFEFLRDNQKIIDGEFGDCFPLFYHKSGLPYFIVGKELKETLSKKISDKLSNHCKKITPERDCISDVMRFSEDLFSTEKSDVIYVSSNEIPLLLRRTWESIYDSL